MRQFLTKSRQETVDLGKLFAASLKPGDVVALFGNLGSGKTQFVIGVCEGLGVRGHIGSPSFTLINEYSAALGTVVHIDLYRINSRAEIAELGIEEYFTGSCICLIEWAESVLYLLPRNYYQVKISYGAGDLDREILVQEVQGVDA